MTEITTTFVLSAEALNRVRAATSGEAGLAPICSVENFNQSPVSGDIVWLPDLEIPFVVIGREWKFTADGNPQINILLNLVPGESEKTRLTVIK